MHACMPVSRVSYTIKTHFDLIRTPNTVLWLQYIYDILVNRVVMYCTHHYNKIIAVFELWWQSNECTCLSMKLSLLVQQLIIFSSSRTKVHCGTEIVVPVWPYLHAMQKLHIFAVRMTHAGSFADMIHGTDRVGFFPRTIILEGKTLRLDARAGE